MAKVTLTLMIHRISGRIGTPVFYAYRKNQYARRYVIPRNPNTPAQKNRRELFANVVAAWQMLQNYKKDQWNQKAVLEKMSGYNLFISFRLNAGTNASKNKTEESFLSLPCQIQSHSVFDSGMPRDGFGMPFCGYVSCVKPASTG
jgi:hypothetical protein